MLQLNIVCTGKAIATHSYKVGGLIQFAPHYMTLSTLSVNREPVTVACRQALPLGHSDIANQVDL